MANMLRVYSRLFGTVGRKRSVNIPLSPPYGKPRVVNWNDMIMDNNDMVIGTVPKKECISSIVVPFFLFYLLFILCNFVLLERNSFGFAL